MSIVARMKPCTHRHATAQSIFNPLFVESRHEIAQLIYQIDHPDLVSHARTTDSKIFI